MNLTTRSASSEKLVGQDLERHVATEGGIACLKHRSHSAFVQFRGDTIWAENLARLHGRWESYAHCTPHGVGWRRVVRRARYGRSVVSRSSRKRVAADPSRCSVHDRNEPPSVTSIIRASAWTSVSARSSRRDTASASNCSKRARAARACRSQCRRSAGSAQSLCM